MPAQFSIEERESKWCLPASVLGVYPGRPLSLRLTL